MTKEEKAAFRGAGRVAFLSRIQEIKEMIDAGHPTKNVYRKHGERLNISYGQFARYVNKFIRSKPSNESKGEKPESTSSTGGKEVKPRKQPFVHDPNSGNLDDFI